MLRYKQRVVKELEAFSKDRKQAANAFRNPVETQFQVVARGLKLFENALETRGAFHYAKDSGNFGQNSNGKVRFGFFRPEYSGSPLEVVLIFRWEYSDRNVLLHLQTFWFPLPLFCHLLFPSWPILRAYNLLRVTNVPFVAILQQTFPNY